MSCFRLFLDGSVEIRDSGTKMNFSSGNFCLNFIQISADGRKLENETFFVCPQDGDDEVIYIGFRNKYRGYNRALRQTEIETGKIVAKYENERERGGEKGKR